MLLDYHAQVNFSAYKDDADEVIKRALDRGVFMVLVGSQMNTSRRAVEMSAQYEKGVYAAVGLHPIHLEEMEVDESEEQVEAAVPQTFKFKTRREVFHYEAYKTLAQHEKVVAIGECGLDYYHLTEDARMHVGSIPEATARQEKTFREHLDLAQELDLPLILHCRGSIAEPTDAYRDMLAILREYVDAGKLTCGGSIHCFTSTLDIAQQYVALGFHVGFTGVITFKNAARYADVIRGLPLDRILVETDCPYMTPVPNRGKRNEPLYVRYTAEKVAEILGTEKEAVEKQLWENSLKVFQRILV